MKGNKLAGLALILFGLLYLTMQVLDEMSIVSFRFWNLWPLFIIIAGLMLEYNYHKAKRAPAILIPGGILLVIGSLHLFESITNWTFSEYTWPLYTFAVFVGFFQYWLVTREHWALVVALILLALFTFFVFIVLSVLFDGIINASMAFSIMLIVIGGILLVGNKKKT